MATKVHEVVTIDPSKGTWPGGEAQSVRDAYDKKQGAK